MKKKVDIRDINENITLFRLFNTLDWWPQTQDKPIYSLLKNLFRTQYSAPTLRRLDSRMGSRGDDTYFFRSLPNNRFIQKEFVQKAYYHVFFKVFKSNDTGNITRQLTISKKDFYLQVQRFLEIMQKGDSIKTTNDYIIFVRLDNTISLGSLFQKIDSEFFNNALFLHFEQLRHNYIVEANVKLHTGYFHIDFYGGHYSTYYGINISPLPEIAQERDYYHILFQ